MVASTFLLEVMDKEPTIIQVWTQFLLLGIIGFAICRMRFQALYVVIPVIALLAYFWYSELIDPQVGQDFRTEAGYGYVYQSYIAITFAIAAPSIGAFIKWKRIKE